MSHGKVGLYIKRHKGFDLWTSVARTWLSSAKLSFENGSLPGALCKVLYHITRMCLLTK